VKAGAGSVARSDEERSGVAKGASRWRERRWGERDGGKREAELGSGRRGDEAGNEGWLLESQDNCGVVCFGLGWAGPVKPSLNLAGHGSLQRPVQRVQRRLLRKVRPVAGALGRPNQARALAPDHIECRGKFDQ
jgi:hypothetical protein